MSWNNKPVALKVTNHRANAFLVFFFLPQKLFKVSLTRVRLTQLRLSRDTCESVYALQQRNSCTWQLLRALATQFPYTQVQLFSSPCVFFFSLTATSKTPHGCMFFQACNLWHNAIVFPHIFFLYFFSVFPYLLLLYSLVPLFLSRLPLSLAMIRLR